MKKKINISLATVILASGSGSRLNKSIPKQYLLLNNKSLLEINIEKFLSLPFAKHLIVVVNRDHYSYYKDLKKKYKSVKFILGSDSRQKSSFNAIKYLKNCSYEYVLIHDAARPFVSKQLIFNLCNKILKHKTSVIPVLKIQDSIKECLNGFVKRNLNRNNIYLSQTPQIFNYAMLYKIYLKKKQLLDNYTDDAQLFSETENKIYTIKGESKNIKITTKQDWGNKKIMEQNNYIIKVGHGFDTHKLINGKSITLFGLKIPHKYSLLGHSDADVGIHAIIDAILGSCSLGDIGKMFPNTEKKYKGIKSTIMLSKVKKLLFNKNSIISHLDCTLVGESPKISKYTDKMCGIISKTLEIEKNIVSIKATTTEGLGFTGRKEGISCYCIVTVKQLIED